MEATEVVVETNFGSFRILLDAEHAPKSVENFLRYVDKNHYDGTVCHRVIPTFMVQGGGYDESFNKRATDSPVENEADNGLKNVRGSVAMARTGEPHSATAQFFVNVVDNDFLDYRGKTQREWGYAVFGKVSEGLDIVDKIKALKTGSQGPFEKDAPLEMVVIKSVRRV